MLRQRAARGAGHLFLGNMLSQVIQGVGMILVARFLGATQYGLYSLILVPSATFFVFTRIGFGASATRYVAYYNAQGRRDLADGFTTSNLLYSTIFYALISLLAAAVAPLYASIVLHQSVIGGLARLATLTIFFQGLMGYTTAALSGYYRTREVAAITLIQAVSKTVLSLALILVGLRLFGAVLGTILSFVFGGVSGTVFLLLSVKNRKFRFDGETLRTAFSFGLPLYAANVLYGLVPQLQLVILASITTAAAIGAFTAAQNLAALVGVVAYPVSTMAVVAFSEVSAQNDSKRMAAAYLSATKMATILVVPTTLFLIFAGRPIVDVLYGPAYAKYYLLLPILAASYLSVGVGSQTQSSLFNSVNNTKINAYMAAITMALLLPLSVGLGLVLGVFGVALAASISFTVAAFVVHLYFVRGMGVRLSAGRLGLVYLAGLLAATPILVIPERIFHHGLIGLSELVLLLAAYTLLYSTLLPLVRGVNRNELSLISYSLSGIPILGNILVGLTKYAGLFVRESEGVAQGGSNHG